jgi:hypothetical protein
MDATLAWLGRWAGLLAIAMVVPALIVIGPWLLSAVGVIPARNAGQLWEQVQPFVMPYLIIWAAAGALHGFGVAADKRIDAKNRRALYDR